MAEQKPIILNPSGKQQLVTQSDRVAHHRDLISMPQWQQSINLALLQYQRQLAENTTDSNGAAAAMFKLKGAQEFIQVFTYLGEELRPVVVNKPELGQLDHKA